MYDICKNKDLIPAYHSYMAKGGTEFWEMMDMFMALMVIMVWMLGIHLSPNLLSYVR